MMVGYGHTNVSPSIDNSSKKMRSVKTIEPEPESLDKNIVTDPGELTPDLDYNEYKTYGPIDDL